MLETTAHDTMDPRCLFRLLFLKIVGRLPSSFSAVVMDLLGARTGRSEYSSRNTVSQTSFLAYKGTVLLTCDMGSRRQTKMKMWSSLFSQQRTNF